MVRLTKEQKKGTRFEIWLETVFSKHYRNVNRNIIYHREKYIFRQVDLEFKDYFIFNPLIIVEAKYSSNGLVKSKLRQKKNKSGARIKNIDNIVTELEERRSFVGARKAILVTNGTFDNQVYEEAEKNSRIIVYNIDDLERLNNSFFSFFKSKTIEEQIKEVDLRKYNLRPERKYI